VTPLVQSKSAESPAASPPGTTSRRVLDHGEQAPAGATIKFAAMNPYKPLLHETVSQRPVNELRLWNSEVEIVTAAYARAFEGASNYVIRRVALITTDSTISYKEEVVA
jgi:hypothetical protein